jgi:hypothetical protein
MSRISILEINMIAPSGSTVNKSISTNNSSAIQYITSSDGSSLDITDAIGGSLSIGFKFSVNPTADSKLTFYGLYSNDDSIYDNDSKVINLIKLSEITLSANTNQIYLTIPLDGKLFSRYLRLAFTCSSSVVDSSAVINRLRATIKKLI